MGTCEECGKTLVGRQRLYCSKACTYHAWTHKRRRTKVSRHSFEPTDLASFYECEEARRRHRLMKTGLA